MLEIDIDGSRYWYNKNGLYNRNSGPACEYWGGSKEWYLNGKRHRIDGPACEYLNGDRKWYVNNQLHRVGGPAIEWANGHKEWWLEGILYTENSYNEKVMEYVKDL